MNWTGIFWASSLGAIVEKKSMPLSIVNIQSKLIPWNFLLWLTKIHNLMLSSTMDFINIVKINIFWWFISPELHENILNLLNEIVSMQDYDTHGVVLGDWGEKAKSFDSILFLYLLWVLYMSKLTLAFFM